MLEQFLISYVDELYEKSNIWADLEQRNLYSKQRYYELLKPVIEIVKKYKDYSIDELRDKIYEHSGLEEKIKKFVYKTEMIPGMVFSYGTKNFKETIVIGNRQEVTLDKDGKLVPAIEKMTEDTIFDLASVTKIFTSLSILKLVEMGVIKLDDSITKYVPQFKNLNNVTIFELLSFLKPLKTNRRVDKAETREEAEKILFDVEIDNNHDGKRVYNDIGPMVLKYVIESVSGMSFYKFVDENILSKLGLNDTNVVIPKYKLDRVASTNFDGMYYKDGNFVINTSAPKGVVYDPKARIMGQPFGNLSGHAGMFSTSKDMTTLAKGIMGGQVIDEEYVKSMAKNRTGRLYGINDKGEKEYVQYFGFLCYLKNPILDSTTVFHALSGQGFSFTGWTGTQITVDPVNELFLFLGSNRSHNRVTFIDAVHNDKKYVDENGKRTILLPNGDIKIDTTKCAVDRDNAFVFSAVELAIQYLMLEKVYAFEKIINKEEERVRYL